MAFDRLLNLTPLLAKKSFFLFGPRGTGKTHLIRKELSKTAFIIDLLQSEMNLRLSSNPSELQNIVSQNADKKRPIVIDEIQKIPALLDEVHRLIEEFGFRFLLTGSSARKLKRGAANLLGGRAWTTNLFPLCWKEIPHFNLERYLRFGGLPSVVQSEFPEEELQAYLQNYIKEEVQAEGLVRTLPAFSRFLKTAALSNGQLINFANIGSDAGISASTIKSYYSILEDTLLGFSHEPWVESKKRKAIATAKFYLFDPGVTHVIAGTKTLDRNSDLFGHSFEQWIGMELRAFLGYNRIFDPLCFWRSTHQHEVDYVIGDHTAVEVKSTRKVQSKHLRGLKALQEERVFKHYYLVSEDRIAKRQDGISCLPWAEFLTKLWAGEIVQS
ncbi:MAG: ATP-binding protein [Deltaproteobacteria bacterium]|nr:ATP-binding protein [Deltaproteobacteria bacterium]MBI3296481.1 ATP-binding protein [Deltaproteobacteria bacterium]